MSCAAPEDPRPYSAYYSRPSGSSSGSAHGQPPPLLAGIGNANGNGNGGGSGIIGVHTSVPGTAPPSSGTSPIERLHSSHGFAKGGPGQPPESPVYHDMDAPPGSSHGYPQPQPPQSTSTLQSAVQSQNQPNPHQSPITPVSSNTYPPQPPSTGYYGLATTNEETDSPPIASRALISQFTPDGIPIVPVGVSGGKMFKCRGYGECDKVFTRSEHLARHVRKHTGERPFPCHCGKAFSRLDNLRQHSATVHSDQSALNDAMLNSLAPVHAALSQRAGRDQRKRGEIVEVPKNAVERPRHNEYRGQKTSPKDGGASGDAQLQTPLAPPSDYDAYQQEWADRSRTGMGYNYEYPSSQLGDEGVGNGSASGSGSGPSRRPLSGDYQPYPYYDQTRPPTASGDSATDSLAQLPYPYRPMSSSGRDLPLPTHYTESEPPSSAHGPPQSPMYPPLMPHSQNVWSSPTDHTSYPPAQTDSVYPPPHGETRSYYDASPVTSHSLPPGSNNYGPAPPNSSGGSSNNAYAYPPPPPSNSSAGYYTPLQQPQPTYGNVPPPRAQYPPAPYSTGGQDSPFQYHAPPTSAGPGTGASVGTGEGQYAYPHPPQPSHSHSHSQDLNQTARSFDRKRRGEEGLDPDDRKHPRSSSGLPDPQNLNEVDASPHLAHPVSLASNTNTITNGNGNNNNHFAASNTTHLSDTEPLWLPPTTERRSSLAISALLGSPQRSRLPATSGLSAPPMPLLSLNTSAATVGSGAGDNVGSAITPMGPGAATYPPQPYPYVPQTPLTGSNSGASGDAGGAGTGNGNGGSNGNVGGNGNANVKAE